MNKPLFVISADDDSDDQLFITEALHGAEACESQLETVNDGEELLTRLHSLYTSNRPLPELILLDLNMPVMNGKEVLKAIKNSYSPYKNIPVWILTTSNSEEDIVYCLREGADRFLVKPNNIEQLTSILNNELASICTEI